MTDPGLVEWISREILPHEKDVRRWLAGRAPANLDVSDIVQDAYSRMARISDTHQIQSGRAYYFSVVRNLLRDHLRRERIVHFQDLAEIHPRFVVDSAPTADRIVEARQALARIVCLLDRLPERCRSIIILRKLEGLSQKQIAAKLGVTENIVEKQIALGLKMLLKFVSEQEAEDEVESLSQEEYGTRRHQL